MNASKIPFLSIWRALVPAMVAVGAVGVTACGSHDDHGSAPVAAATPAPAPQTVRYTAQDLPLDVVARFHGCQKVSYTALGNFLSARGVNLAKTSTPPSAGQLYAGAVDAMGMPKVDSRTREPSFLTTAAATKLFDIFVQAALEIIPNISDPTKAPACTLSGANSPMFDATGACVENSITCLIGRPATPNDVILCNLLVSQADPTNPADVARKQQIAVATMLSAAHTCE
jgi:hypothetical protein